MATTQPGGLYQNPDGTFVDAEGRPIDAPPTEEAATAGDASTTTPPTGGELQTGTADDFARTDEGTGEPKSTGPEETAKVVKPGKDAAK